MRMVKMKRSHQAGTGSPGMDGGDEDIVKRKFRPSELPPPFPIDI